MILANFLHILGFTVWVGGMFFAYMALRPVAASRLEPDMRLRLWEGVFEKFFFWVWASVVAILISGLYMMAKMGHPPFYVTAMFLTGVIMMSIFGHIFFAPYKRLKRAVSASDWKAAAAALNQIRTLVAINLVLGVITIAIGSLGRLIG